MRFILPQISNYILAFLMICYAVLALFDFAVKKGTGKSVIAGCQNMCNIFIALTGFFHLYYVTDKAVYLLICLGVVVALLMMLGFTKLIYRDSNRLLLNNMSMLFTVGILILSRISTGKVLRQFVVFLISLMVSMAIPLIFLKINFFRKLTWAYAGVGLAMIASVYIAGEVIHGSRINISVFGLTFQPSEAVKILFVFFLAGMLWDNYKFKNIVFTSLVSALFVIILVISRDLGSALIFYVVFMFVVYVSSGNSLYLIGLTGLGAGFSVLAYKLFSHVRIRFIIWKDPWSDIDNKGYQIAQSLFKITGGGLFGMGLGNGSPRDIPYVETDFIFSAIAEELGIIFAIGLLLVSLSSFIEMMRLASKIVDPFYRLVVYGIALSLTFQTFLTVGGGTKFIPLTGVTYPLVSYGGTSMLVSMVMYYIVQAVYIKLRKETVDNALKPFIFHKKPDRDRNNANRFKKGN